MRDEHYRPPKAAPDIEQEVLHLRAGETVERAERLVEEHEGTVLDHRAHERCALAHAAGEREGIGSLEAGEAEEGKQLARLPLRLGLAHTLDLQRQRDVPQHGAPGKEEILLGHVGDRVQITADRRSSDLDRAGVGNVEPGDEAEEGALSAAARPDQADELAAAGVEVHLQQHLEGGHAPAPEALRDERAARASAVGGDSTASRRLAGQTGAVVAQVARRREA